VGVERGIAVLGRAASAVLLFTGAALAQDITSANDTCSNPFLGGDGSFSVVTSGATPSGVMATGLPPWSGATTPDTACEDFDGIPEDLHKDVWMQWTAGVTGDYEISTCNLSSYDSKLALYTNSCPAPTALSCNDDSPNCSGFSSTLRATLLTAGATYLIQIGGFDASVSGAATLTISPSIPCSMQLDDAFEPNDSCGAPAALSLGSYSNLFLGSTRSEDYFQISGILDGEILGVDASGDITEGNLDLFIYDSSCQLVASSESSTTSNEGASVANLSGAPADYVVRVSRVDATAGCNTYELDLSSVGNSCIGVDDLLEENDDCASAVPQTDGTSTTLFASLADPDFYEVAVADGDTLSVNVTFSHAAGDMDAYVYDPAACGDTLVYLERGFSASDNESLSWQNVTGMQQTYIVSVVIYEFTPGPECNDYDITIAGTLPLAVGSNYCQSAPNSVTPTGGLSGSIMSASGSTSVTANDLVVRCGPQAALQPVIFFYGTTQLGPGGDGLPFGNGLRCTGGDVVRFFPPGFADAAGFYELAIDNTRPAVVTSQVPIADATTLHFQGWYRDPDGGGAGFNLSDALTVTFTP